MPSSEHYDVSDFSSRGYNMPLISRNRPNRSIFKLAMNYDADFLNHADV